MVRMTDKSNNESSHKDVDGGWAWVIMGSAFVSSAILSGLFYTFSIYFVLFLAVFKESRSYTSWIASLNSASFFFAGPLASFVIRRYGCRKSVIVGSILCAAGYLGCSLANSVLHLIFSYGLVHAVGACLIFTSWIVALSRYFKRLHYISVGVSLSGSGVGILMMGPITEFFVQQYGWRGSLVLNAGLSLNICVLGALIFPIGTNADRVSNDQVPNIKVVDGGDVNGDESSTRDAEIHAVLMDPRFWMMNTCCFLYEMGGLTLYLVYKDFAASRNLGDSFTIFLLCLGVGDIIGRLMGGFIPAIGNIPPLVYFLCVLFTSGMIILFHIVAYNFWTFAVLCLMFGCAFGNVSVLLPIAQASLFGSRLAAETFGYALILAGFGTLVGPPLVGFLTDRTGNYTAALLFSACAMWAGLVLMSAIYSMNERMKQDAESCLPNGIDYSQPLMNGAKLKVSGPLRPNKSAVALSYGSNSLRVEVADWKAISFHSLQSLHFH